MHHVGLLHIVRRIQESTSDQLSIVTPKQDILEWITVLSLRLCSLGCVLYKVLQAWRRTASRNGGSARLTQ